MRKNLNKIVAFAIGISIISGSIVPAMAYDTNNINNIQVQSATENAYKILTLDEAINAAIENSEDLKKLNNTMDFQEKSISLTRKINSINEKMLNAKEELYDIDKTKGEKLEDYEKDFKEKKSDYEEDLSELNLKISKQSKQFAEDGVKFKVTNQYNGIVISQMKIDKQQKQLQISIKELEDQKLKNNLGLATSVDTSSKENDIQKAKDSLENEIRQLNDSKYELGQTIGKDLSNYTLQNEIKYDPLLIDDSDLDDYLKGIMSNYIDKQGIEELMHLSEEISKEHKDYMDDYKDKIDDAESNMKDYENKEPNKENYTKTDENGQKVEDSSAYEKALLEYETNKSLAEIGYYGAELSYYTEKLTMYSDDLNNNNKELELQSIKKSYMNALRGYYTTLIDKQNNILTSQKNLEINNKKLANTKLQYDLGLTTKSQYDSAILVNEDLNIALLNSIIECNKYKDMIEKPWLSLK